MTDAPQITVSQNAAKRIAAILSKEPKGAMLRIGVEGGGCSGFQYTFNIVDDQNEDDLTLDADGFLVLIDQMSIPFMEGSEIDFSTDLIGAAFKINNPNAQANCGCGTSFSI